ncbi:hypothetical protein, partial [Mycoplasma sp. 613B]
KIQVGYKNTGALYISFKDEISIFIFIASFVDLSLLSLLIVLFYKYSKKLNYIYIAIFLSFSYILVIILTILSSLKIISFNNNIVNSILINAASFCISFASLPQLIKGLFFKKMKGLSLFYKSLVLTVEILWFTYWLIAGLITIYNLDGGIAISITEMIQLLIWSSFAIITNSLVILMILIKNKKHSKNEHISN